MRKRLYDWSSLFTRARFTLVRGRDYTCSQSSIVQQVRNAATQQEPPARVKIRDEGTRVVVEVN